MLRASLSGIQITREQRRKMRELIADYFTDEENLELGMIAQDDILDFFLENLGPMIYNAALDDAHAWAQQAASNAETDYYALYKEE